MSRVGLESTIPAFERAKTVHAFFEQAVVNQMISKFYTFMELGDSLPRSQKKKNPPLATILS
jgi:hypothetical protein